MNCTDELSVEWHPLALFDAHSQFVLLFRDVCLDIGIHGDTVRVTQTDENGYRAVGFGSHVELEYFLMRKLRKAALAK